MGLEVVVGGAFPNALNEDWPLGGDSIDEGDDHLRIIKRVFRNMFQAYVGIPFAHDKGAISPHMIAYDGSSIDPVTEPILYAKFGATMPDYSGRALVGLKGTEFLGAEIDDVDKAHTHPVSMHANNSEPAHLSIFKHGTRQTSLDGQHLHDMRGFKYVASHSVVRLINMYSGGHASLTTGEAGEHHHTFPLGTHKHTVNFPSHTHNAELGWDTDPAHPDEGRVKSVLVIWITFRG